jgi:RNA polymerase sigma-54 factor
MVGPYLSQTQQQRQQMVLAPQLRQSLEFLTVPMLELSTLIRKELEQNPTLEERLPDNEHIEVEPEPVQPKDEAIKDFGEEYEVLAQIDDDWNEYFRQSAPPRPGHTQEEDERNKFILDSITPAESLQEHLLAQLAIAGLPANERAAAEWLIGNINEDGYLASPLTELAESAPCPPDQLEQVLAIVREFDPIGVGSTNLRECLLFQLQREGRGDALESALVRDHLDALGAHKYAAIAKHLRVDVEAIKTAAVHIAQLEPKPGRRFSGDTATYVVPEVFVQKVNGDYIVTLNDRQMPHIRISKRYRHLMENPDTPADVKDYIRDKIRAGAFMIKSIYQRQQTIRHIAEEIVHAQRDFLDRGVAHLRPLTMSEVAEIVDVHETTVSRAVSGKYMQTPQGIYEMKYFFTTGYQTADGVALSNRSIQNRIGQMIAQEDTAKPLSDQAIADRLKADGIPVARRTVAKYREELKLPPSHLRKISA